MGRVQLAEGAYRVGTIDWNIRNFRGYSTHLGTTYNAYLVVDEKIALIETVKAPVCDEMIARIKEFVSVAVKAIQQELGQAGIGVLDSDLAFKFVSDKDEI